MPIEIVEGPAAEHNVAQLPANVLIYGPPGTRKTTDACAAFTRDGRCSAFAIPCEDGALKILSSRKMPVPSHPKATVKSWGQMQETIAWLAQHGVGRYNAVLIDGFSPLSTYLYNEVTASLGPKGNKWDIPVAVNKMLFQLREWIRMLGMHSVFIAHAEPPAVQDGIAYQGAFKCTPRKMVREYFGQLDTVLRVDWLRIPGREPMLVYYTGGSQWPTELGPMSQPPDMNFWLTKNREGCNAAIVPADLGAFLRGRQPPYPGL